MKYIVLLLLIPFLAFSQNQKGVSPIANNQESTATKSTYAVVVGISDYQDAGIPDLRYADKDAEAFANYLRSSAGGQLDNDHLKVLLNEKATVAQFAIALDWLMEVVKENDQVIIYFSGHGDVEKSTITQPGYLLCWDAPSRVYLAGGALALPMFQDIITTLSIQNKARVVVITDACRSGKLAGSSVGGSQITGANLAKQYSNEIKILSCQPNEYSIEGEQWGGGRGVFSYYLVDGLFGLADRNNDGQVTLGEIDRYLEDHVTGESAPQSQVPILLGNKTDKMATVDANILADLKKNRAGNLAVFAATESRGFEEEILGKVDSSVRNTYQNFILAVKEKRFFPAPLGTLTGNSAEDYYIQLEKVEILVPLKGNMKRNYAAALQDDAQQAMNIWLAADVQQLECIGKSLKLDPIPRQLQRAAELLGERHYMYRSLQARRLLFEGILKMKNENLDQALGRECLFLFQQSLALEAQSPLPFYRMCLVYALNMRNPDSAFVCARQARNLAPNWVLPFADLGYALIHYRKLDLAKQALKEAEAIDSLHPYVINRWASWFKHQPGQANQKLALSLYEKYRESGGTLYPCWFNDYGDLLQTIGRHTEAEQQYQKALALDTTNTTPLGNLGFLYTITRRYAEAESVLKKAIAIDSTNDHSWNNLGILYTTTRRYAESEPILQQCKVLDSTNCIPWKNLGTMYLNTQRYAEAELHLKKAIALDSTLLPAWNDLGVVYFQTRRYTEAEPVLKKCIVLDSTNRSPWNNLGALYIQTHRYTEAEPVFIKAIALDSTFANARKHLGMVCFKTNRPEEARQNFLKAIELNPKYAPSVLGMAYLLTAEGKIEEAFGYMEQAIEKGVTMEQIQKDEDLAPLRALPVWKELMKKYFPEKVK